jgi:hypothetical protein
VITAGKMAAMTASHDIPWSLLGISTLIERGFRKNRGFTGTELNGAIAMRRGTGKILSCPDMTPINGAGQRIG